MQLHAEPSAAGPVLQRVAPDAIRVDGRDLRRSFILHPGGLLEHWPVSGASDLDEAALAPLLSLDPEVILLGTGSRQTFPPQAALAACLRRGIGLEAMDNAAAARTYSVLAGEGRRVVAAFMLPGG